MRPVGAWVLDTGNVVAVALAESLDKPFHRSIATTATYLARMEGEEDNGWEGVATALGV